MSIDNLASGKRFEHHKPFAIVFKRGTADPIFPQQRITVELQPLEHEGALGAQ